MQCYLRHGVVEGGERAADYRDVHHVPEVAHESAGVQDEALVQDLQREQPLRRDRRPTRPCISSTQDYLLEGCLSENPGELLESSLRGLVDVACRRGGWHANLGLQGLRWE